MAQKCDHAGDILPASRPSQRRLPILKSADFMDRHLLVAPADIPRANHVHRDAIRRLLDGQRLRKGHKPGFGCRINGPVGPGARLGGMTKPEMDDPPPSLLPHPRQHEMIQQQAADQIPLDHAQHFALAVIGKQLAFPNKRSGIVDQNINGPQLLVHLTSQFLALLPARYIGLHCDTTYAKSLDVRSERERFRFAMYVI
ncbi:hypothetical protein D3C81_859970 [compost metagenome]